MVINKKANQPGSGLSGTNEDKSLAEIKECFKNSLKGLETLIKEYSNSASRGSIISQLSLTQQQASTSTREDKLHGYLLVILEIVKFAAPEFENQIEKYLLTYNLYHQRAVHHSSSSSPTPLTNTSSTSGKTRTQT